MIDGEQYYIGNPRLFKEIGVSVESHIKQIESLQDEGKNPMQLDSKEPDWSKFQDFLKGEVRYTSLIKQFPAEAEELFKAAEKNAKWRYNGYKRMADQQF